VFDFWSAVTCHRFGPGRPAAQTFREFRPRHGRDRSRPGKSGDRSPHSRIWHQVAAL